MSTLDDFFGDSRTAVKECLYCGGQHGELAPAAFDANGVTLWKHRECAKIAAEKDQAEDDDNDARWQAYELYNQDIN